ncbi:MAG: hypothetical protein KDK76_02670 [Chlamydiia bacterium]|nr:hypothetical protein [Chlamydiia bacterium]
MDSWNRISDFIELSAKICEMLKDSNEKYTATGDFKDSRGAKYKVEDIFISLSIDEINKKIIDEKVKFCFSIFLEEHEKKPQNKSFAEGRSCLEILMNEELRKTDRVYDVVIARNEASLEFNLRQKAEIPTQCPRNFYPLFKDSFDRLHEVQQGQYAITSANSAKPVLGSWHFESCIGFAALSPALKIGILAHIDEHALDRGYMFEYKIFGNLFLDIEKSFQNNETDEEVEIEYVLIGGCKEPVGYYALIDAREYVRTCIERFESKNIKFKLIEEKGEKISTFDFNKDYSWAESLRLERSVALDTRKASLREALVSYEAELNPHSSLHKRNLTREESDAFETNRKSTKDLLLSPVPPNEKN